MNQLDARPTITAFEASPEARGRPRQGTRDHLDVVMVLRRLEGTGILEEYPNLSAFVRRGQARPAYGRAFADQHAVFTGRQRAS